MLIFSFKYSNPTMKLLCSYFPKQKARLRDGNLLKVRVIQGLISDLSNSSIYTPQQCFLFLTLEKQIVGMPVGWAHGKIISLHLGSVLGLPSAGPKDSWAFSPEGDWLPLLTSTSSLIFQSILHYFSNFPSLYTGLVVNFMSTWLGQGMPT